MAPKLVPLLLLSLSLFLLPLLNQSVESRKLKPSTVSNNFTQLLQTLEGSVKGQKDVEGLNQLKRYLQHYGYYPNAADDNLIIDDDDFDETLDSAVKLYQKNFRLPVTGRVDARTIKEMTVPRCGNPDIVHRSVLPSGDSKFHMVVHYTFFRGHPRWSKSQLTYSFVGTDQVVPFDKLRQVCSSAFSKWAQNSEFKFQEVAQGANSDITIGFFSGYHNIDPVPFDGPGGVLAHSFQPELGVFHYDADENWSTQPGVDQIDLESVTVHEIGHLLGLGHSMDPNAVMFPTIRPGVEKRDLTQDDIDGIRTLYPN